MKQIMPEMSANIQTPTVEDLLSLYRSATYQKLLEEYDAQAKHKLDARVDDDPMPMLMRLAGRYHVLNISFEEVLSEFEQRKEELLRYFTARVNFFNDTEDDCPDGEFSEGEEPGEDDKSEVIESFGISRTFILDTFCEFYILNLGDKERLLHYLKATRMPQAKKFAGQLTKLFKQACRAE